MFWPPIVSSHDVISCPSVVTYKQTAVHGSDTEVGPLETAACEKEQPNPGELKLCWTSFDYTNLLSIHQNNTFPYTLPEEPLNNFKPSTSKCHSLQSMGWVVGECHKWVRHDLLTFCKTSLIVRRALANIHNFRFIDLNKWCGNTFGVLINE